MKTCNDKPTEQLNLCNSSLKLNDKKTPTFDEYLKDKYIHLKYNLYQNRNYRFNKVKKEILKDYNALYLNI